MRIGGASGASVWSTGDGGTLELKAAKFHAPAMIDKVALGGFNQTLYFNGASANVANCARGAES